MRRNTNRDKTQKVKLWQISKTQIVTKLKKSNWDKILNSKCDKIKKKNQIVTKLKKNPIVTKLKNKKCDKTQKLKLWQNSKVKLWQNLKKNKFWPKLKKNSNCDNSNLKLRKNSTQMVTVGTVVLIVTYFSKNPAYGRQSISRPMRIVAPMP